MSDVRLNAWDRMIAAISPRAGVERLAARRALAYYEAAQPSRLRQQSRDHSSGDRLAQMSARQIRAQARHLDRNHDLARGALNVLVRNIVGPKGIGIDPQPRTADDDIHDDFARQLSHAWAEWSERPEVSWQHDWAAVCHLMARSWLRDGDGLAQLISGRVPLLDHGTEVAFSLELIEADHLPLDYHDDARNIRAGIQRNAWGRPTAYWLYKHHPGDERSALIRDDDLKAVPADRIAHLRQVDRIGQLRGVSVMASVITRLEDIKDYEESERVAAKIAACLAAYIRKGGPQEYQGGPVDDQGNPVRRNLRMQAGLIFDDLQPGEEVGVIDSKRPNPQMGAFRNANLRAVAGGMDVGYSSMSRDYSGNYSAQRQELVEQRAAYELLTAHFVGQFVRPVWRAFVAAAIASGRVRVPAGIDRRTLDKADFRGPPMPWIDPKKEAEALRLMTRSGFRSVTQIVRERGANVIDTFEELARERRLARELDLTLESDAATKGSNPGAANLDGDSAPPPNTGDTDDADDADEA